MKLQTAIKSLENIKGVKFRDLLKICETFFGEARIKGGHFIFKPPWPGRINIQKDGNMAKAYQVKQVLSALNKLKVGGEK